MTITNCSMKSQSTHGYHELSDEESRHSWLSRTVRWRVKTLMTIMNVWWRVKALMTIMNCPMKSQGTHDYHELFDEESKHSWLSRTVRWRVKALMTITNCSMKSQSTHDYHELFDEAREAKKHYWRLEFRFRQTSLLVTRQLWELLVRPCVLKLINHVPPG